MYNSKSIIKENNSYIKFGTYMVVYLVSFLLYSKTEDNSEHIWTKAKADCYTWTVG